MVSSLLAMFFFSVTETTQERKVYLAPSLSEWPIIAETAWYRGQLELWWQKCVAASHSASVVRKPRDECWSSHHFGASALGAVLPVFQGINLSGNTPRDTPVANLLGISRPSPVDSEDSILFPSSTHCPV